MDGGKSGAAVKDEERSKATRPLARPHIRPLARPPVRSAVRPPVRPSAHPPARLPVHPRVMATRGHKGMGP